MKLLIAALLTVFSTSVMAEWDKLGPSVYGTVYVDISLVRKSGDKVKVWTLLDFNPETKVCGEGKECLSSTAQNEYDCKEETWRTLTYHRTSKNMGKGDMVESSGNLHEEFAPVSPTGADRVIFKIFCGK